MESVVILILLLIATIYSLVSYIRNPWKKTMLGLGIFFGILLLIMAYVVVDGISARHYNEFVSMLC